MAAARGARAAKALLGRARQPSEPQLLITRVPTVALVERQEVGPGPFEQKNASPRRTALCVLNTRTTDCIDVVPMA